MQRPKVGDTVILRAIVAEVDTSGSFDLLKLNFIDCASPGVFSNTISINRVHAIIEAPLQVGDTVSYENSPWEGGTLLHIHQAEGDARQWAVVAYKGDIPKAVAFDTLKAYR